MDAPTLTTARLRLRPAGSTDTDALHALWTDPKVRRWLWDDDVIPRATVEAVIADGAASFAAHGYGHWLVVDDTDGVVGFCGLRRVVDGGEVELLYALAPAFWGKGYATEAARAVLAHGFDRVGLGRIVAQTDVPNAASVRVLERLGMTRERRVRKGWAELVDYALRSTEFRR